MADSQVYDNTAASLQHTSITSTREMLQQKAQQHIDEINAKRKQDTQLLEDFKKALEMQVMKECSMIEQNMFDLYEQQGKVIQTKLQELFKTLDRIEKIETELGQFRQALGLLYQDVNHP